MSTSIFAFVVVLGVLIFFHELGHFLVARFFNVGVEKFSLGFGPRLVGKKIGITDYRISAVPLGGYVKMVGEEPDAVVDPENIPISFTHQHVAKRILIVASGPIFNLLLAVVIFFCIFQFSGYFVLKPTIGDVGAGTPAEAAGLMTGDQVLAIDQAPVETWDEMAHMISESRGRSLDFIIRRKEAVLQFRIKPQLQTRKDIFGEDTEKYVIGISAAGDVFSKDLNILEAAFESVSQTYKITRLTLVSIIKLIQGTISAKTLGGPIMIAQMAGQQAREGALNLVFFIALLSINLAILNLLPIPVLDGGHLLFFFIEAAIRRPLNKRLREISQQVGMFVLIFLMIYVFYNDIARLFFS